MHNLSTIISNKDRTQTIIGYFPNALRNFKIYNIYNGSRDGWTFEIFKQRVFSQGPTLIIIKTTDGAVCGGFAFKSWDGSDAWVQDNEAFVFNMETKWIPNSNDNALYADKQGFSFGNYILTVTGDVLNRPDAGWCKTGFENYYDISWTVSPLTQQKDRFTCA